MASIYDFTLNENIYYVDFSKGVLAKATLKDYITEFFPKLLPKCVDGLHVFLYAMFETNHNCPRVYVSLKECIYWESSNYQEENMGHADQVEEKTWGLVELEELHGITFF